MLHNMFDPENQESLQVDETAREAEYQDYIRWLKEEYEIQEQMKRDIEQQSRQWQEQNEMMVISSADEEVDFEETVYRSPPFSSLTWTNVDHNINQENVSGNDSDEGINTTQYNLALRPPLLRRQRAHGPSQHYRSVTS